MQNLLKLQKLDFMKVWYTVSKLHKKQLITNYEILHIEIFNLSGLNNILFCKLLFNTSQIIYTKSEYDVILNGTPKNISADL